MRRLQLLIFCFIFCFCFIGNVYAVCEAPEKIMVRFGSDDTSYQQVSIEDPIQIKSNYTFFPLELDFIMTVKNLSCIEDENMLFRLSKSGRASVPERVERNIDQEFGEATITAHYSYSFERDASFVGQFSVKSGGEFYSYDVEVDVDGIVPQILIKINVPTNNQQDGIHIYGLPLGREVIIDLSIVDQSGIAKVCYGVNCTDFTGDKRVKLRQIETISVSRIVSILVEDIVGNIEQIDVHYHVDTRAPELLEVTNYGEPPSRVNLITAVFSDDDIEQGKQIPVRADVSEFSSAGIIAPKECFIEDKQQKCIWTVSTTLQQSDTKTITFYVNDSVGNGAVLPRTISIIADASPPVITDIQSLNRYEITNTVASGSEALLVVFIEDESSMKSLRVILQGRDIGTYDTNLTTTDTGRYVWNITEVLREFATVPRNVLTVQVDAVDTYGNAGRGIGEILLDNTPVTILDIVVKENPKMLVKDGFLTGGELMDMEVTLSDNVNINEIQANFNNIASAGGLGAVNGQCVEDFDNASRILCSFTSIEVISGFLETTVPIQIVSNAGIREVYEHNITIFGVANSTSTGNVSAFVVEPVGITNPLERNMVLNGLEVPAWFEGEIATRNNIERDIIGYRLLGCNDSGIDPLVLESSGLFPDSVGVGNQFIIKALLAPIQDSNALQPRQFACYLGVVSKNSTTVFTEESVEVQLGLTFFNIPRGDLVEAHAAKMKEMMDRIQVNNGIFTKVFKLYKTFDNICTTFNTLNGVLSATTMAVGGVTVGFGFLAQTMQPYYCAERTYSIEIWDKVSEVIGKICGYVTCDINKKLYGGFFEEYGDNLLVNADQAWGGEDGGAFSVCPPLAATEQTVNVAEQAASGEQISSSPTSSSDGPQGSNSIGPSNPLENIGDNPIQFPESESSSNAFPTTSVVDGIARGDNRE